MGNEQTNTAFKDSLLSLPNEAPSEQTHFTKVKANDFVGIIAQTKKETSIEKAKFIDDPDIYKYQVRDVIYSLLFFQNRPKPRTVQLFIAILKSVTETGLKNKTAYLELNDYMKLRGLKDRKEAAKQVREDIEIIKQWELSGGNTDRYGFVKLFQEGEAIKGNVRVMFSDFFANYFDKMPVNIMPEEIFKINTKHLPNGVPLLYKISQLVNTNAGKYGNVIKNNPELIGKKIAVLSVKTALEACPYIPDVKEVRESKSGQVYKRIVEPLEKTLESFDSIDWFYCKKNGEHLTSDELEHLYDDYDRYFGYNICTYYKERLSVAHTEILDNREQRRKAIARSKAKRMSEGNKPKRGRKKKATSSPAP